MPESLLVFGACLRVSVPGERTDRSLLNVQFLAGRRGCYAFDGIRVVTPGCASNAYAFFEPKWCLTVSNPWHSFLSGTFSPGVFRNIHVVGSEQALSHCCGRRNDAAASTYTATKGRLQHHHTIEETESLERFVIVIDRILII